MKDKFLELVPLRDTPLALVYSLLWLIALWAFQTPEDERIAVCVLAYFTFWTSRLIVANLVVFVQNRLRLFALNALQDAKSSEIVFSDETPAGFSTGIKITQMLLMLAVIAEILGLAFLTMTPIGHVIGLTPLGTHFNIVGWTLLSLGTLTLSILFIISFSVYAIVKSLTHAPESPLNRIEQSQGWIRKLAV